MILAEKYKGFDIMATDDDKVTPRKFIVSFGKPLHVDNEYESLDDAKRAIRDFVNFYIKKNK